MPSDDDNWRNGKALKLVLDGHTKRILSSTTVSQHESVFVTAQMDSVMVWDVAAAKCAAQTSEHVDKPTCLSAAAEILAVGLEGGAVELYELATCAHMRRVGALPGQVNFLRLLRGGKVLVAACRSHVRVFPLDGASPPDDAPLSKPGCVGLLCSSAWDSDDSIIIASGDASGEVHVWEYNERTGLELRHTLVGHSGAVNTVLMLNEHEVASGGSDRMVRVWNVQTGKCTHLYAGHSQPITHLAAEGQLLVSGSADCSARVWNLDYVGQCVAELHGHKAPLTALQLRGNTEVITGAADGTLRVWTATGQLLYVLTVDLGKTSVEHVALVANELALLSVARGSNIALWCFADPTTVQWSWKGRLVFAKDKSTGKVFIPNKYLRGARMPTSADDSSPALAMSRSSLGVPKKRQRSRSASMLRRRGGGMSPPDEHGRRDRDDDDDDAAGYGMVQVRFGDGAGLAAPTGGAAPLAAAGGAHSPAGSPVPISVVHAPGTGAHGAGMPMPSADARTRSSSGASSVSMASSGGSVHSVDEAMMRNRALRGPVQHLKMTASRRRTKSLSQMREQAKDSKGQFRNLPPRSPSRTSTRSSRTASVDGNTRRRNSSASSAGGMFLRMSRSDSASSISSEDDSFDMRHDGARPPSPGSLAAMSRRVVAPPSPGSSTGGLTPTPTGASTPTHLQHRAPPNVTVLAPGVGKSGSIKASGLAQALAADHARRDLARIPSPTSTPAATSSAATSSSGTPHEGNSSSSDPESVSSSRSGSSRSSGGGSRGRGWAIPGSHTHAQFAARAPARAPPLPLTPPARSRGRHLRSPKMSRSHSATESTFYHAHSAQRAREHAAAAAGTGARRHSLVAGGADPARTKDLLTMLPPLPASGDRGYSSDDGSGASLHGQSASRVGLSYALQIDVDKKLRTHSERMDTAHSLDDRVLFSDSEQSSPALGSGGSAGRRTPPSPSHNVDALIRRGRQRPSKFSFDNRMPDHIDVLGESDVSSEEEHFPLSPLQGRSRANSAASPPAASSPLASFQRQRRRSGSLSPTTPPRRRRGSGSLSPIRIMSPPAMPMLDPADEMPLGTSSGSSPHLPPPLWGKGDDIFLRASGGSSGDEGGGGGGAMPPWSPRVGAQSPFAKRKNSHTPTKQEWAAHKRNMAVERMPAGNVQRAVQPQPRQRSYSTSGAMMRSPSPRAQRSASVVPGSPSRFFPGSPRRMSLVERMMSDDEESSGESSEESGAAHKGVMSSLFSHPARLPPSAGVVHGMLGASGGVLSRAERSPRDDVTAREAKRRAWNAKPRSERAKSVVSAMLMRRNSALPLRVRRSHSVSVDSLDGGDMVYSDGVVGLSRPSVDVLRDDLNPASRTRSAPVFARERERSTAVEAGTPPPLQGAPLTPASMGENSFGSNAEAEEAAAAALRGE